jgi:septin 7
VSIQSISADIEENGVRLRLTVVDTPGFGDFVNNDESWRPIVDNIDQRFDAYLDAENKVNRMNIVDNRVHACVYFIQPTGHALKPLDIEVMRRLHTKVNLIPVIAKADTLTDEEIATFKQRVCLASLSNSTSRCSPTFCALASYLLKRRRYIWSQLTNTLRHRF